MSVEDNNGGSCGQLLLDGVPWRAPLHSPAKVQPGLHHLACGDTAGALAFTVASGQTFHFDYWGP